MEKKRLKLQSDKNVIKDNIDEKKEDINVARTKKKAKTIIDKNLLSSALSYKYSEYLDQNEEFCDYMEDCALSINNFNKESYRHLFCIFDGHGGNSTAKLCVKRYPEIFKKCLLESPFDYEQALKKSFLLMDKEIEKTNGMEVGNTATVVFINNKLLYCANVGDSSCCLIGKTAEFISVDHKCKNKKEAKRIEKEGGRIEEDRLNGILCITRGLGDFDLKNKGLIADPHVVKRLIDHSLDYCVIASDGVWDVLSPDDVAKITQEHNIDDLAKIIVETAKNKGSEDNISCIVIELNRRLSLNK
jgi:serine/threonine protein phosphatase PrpC